MAALSGTAVARGAVYGAARPAGADDPIEVAVIDGALLRTARGSSPTGNVKVVTGLTETLLPGCDITLQSINGDVVVNIVLAISQYRVGVGKAATMRLRRTNVAGTLLWSLPFGDLGDSRTGHQQVWVATAIDTVPTDGRYVLTIQETAGDGSTEIWSDTREFSARSGGKVLAVLDGARKVRWMEVLNDIGSASFVISTSDPKARYLEPGNLVRFRLHGADRFAAWMDAPERVVASVDGRSGEYWTVNGRGAVSMLDRARVAPGTGTTTALPAAALLTQFIDAASSASRPALLPMYRDFGPTYDSAGAMWEDAAAWAIADGEPVLNVWRQMTALGIESRMTTDLRLQAYRDGYGSDRSATVVFRQGRHMRGQVTQSFPLAERLSRVWVKGSGVSLIQVFGDEADPRLVREGFISVSSTDEPSALTVAGQIALQQSQLAADAFHVPLRADSDPGGFLPYVDYNVGDTVGVDFPDYVRMSRSRIVALTVEQGEGGTYTVDADFNSVRYEQLVRFKRQFDKSQTSALTA